MFDSCIKNGVFPNIGKTAELILLPKGGNRDERITKLFRPISLLMTIVKPLEIFIVKRLTSETNLDSVIEQHGYTVGKSTVSAIREM